MRKIQTYYPDSIRTSLMVLCLFIFLNSFPISAAGISGYYISGKSHEDNEVVREIEQGLIVGVGKEKITPDPMVKDWVTGKPYQGIEDDIYVSAIALSDGRTEVVMVTWDLTDAGESATAEVRKAISAKLKIPGEQILVNASHNHSAPWSPVYQAGYRGKELDTWWAVRFMPRQNEDPYFKKWMKLLIDQTVKAAQEAHNSLQPAELWIGRVDASKYMNNRRQREAKWGILEANIPNGYNYKNENYNPDVVVGGASFGPMDRTMVLLSFRDIKGNNIVSIFHAAIHGVSIYPYSQAISGDWPEEASKQIGNAIGGKAVFFQGSAGDINPWKRGKEAVDEMGKGLARLAKEAYEYSSKLAPGKLNVLQSKVWLPLSNLGKERTGLDSVAAEIQVISYGSLAFVTLPGEPLTALGTEIRESSPFPQTLVLGYSNGNGVHYASLPKEKQYGGYEVEIGTSGTENAGNKLIAEAVKLLEKAKDHQDK
ncbi:MAG: neutral/alkaline non-lysosomal ceramidase N-terminal domain-containing protein [Sphingobacteriaceae bacterium]